MLQHGHIIVTENIEKVWSYFNMSEQNLNKIDSSIVGVENFAETMNVVGTTFNHIYEYGNKRSNQETKVINFVDSEDKKIIGISYNHLNRYEVRRIHTLEKIGLHTTKVTCVIERIPLHWYINLIMYLPSKKTPVNVDKHLQNLKNIIEEKDE